jgi:hypothetical protein
MADLQGFQDADELAQRYLRIRRMWGEDPYNAACLIATESGYCGEGGIPLIHIPFSEYLCQQLKHARDEIEDLLKQIEELEGDK